MIQYFVAAGSNLGDRLATLRSARDMIAASEGVGRPRSSTIYETRPLGPGSGNFFNAAFTFAAVQDPASMLALLLSIEAQHGRVRRTRWGDRTLDLDLCCAFEGSQALERDEPGLRLPHPELRHRDFVLVPLLDLDPDLRVGGRSCAELVAALPDEAKTIVRRVGLPL